MSPEAFQRRCGRIREIGCIACRRRGYWGSPPDVHHLNKGGHAGQERRGDDCTIGLCPWHHRGVPWMHLTEHETRALIGPSLALQPTLFRTIFGSDDELLAEQNILIERAESLGVGAML